MPVIPYCAFPNIQAAATAIQRFHKDAYVDVVLTARPYNRFEPLNTTWWLIPSTKWPAYRLPKLYFYRGYTAEGESILCLGLVAEKGFGRVVASVDPRIRAQILDAGWFWPKLLADLAVGKLDSAVAQVAEQTGMPVTVSMDAAYYQHMEPGDPYALRNQRDELVFHARDAHLELTRQSLVVNLLRSVAGVRTLAELGRGLESVRDQDWIWINLGFHVTFKMVPLDSGPGLPADAWDEARLWDRAIVPWLPWVKQSGGWG